MIAALFHPFRWTRLFFKALMGTMPAGRATAAETDEDWDDNNMDEGYDAASRYDFGAGNLWETEIEIDG